MTHRPSWEVALILVIMACTCASAQDAQPYSKTLPDGSRVDFNKLVITEFRSRPASANPNAPPGELYSDKEWKVVISTLRLHPVGRGGSVILWKDELTYPVEQQQVHRSAGDPHVRDVILRGNRAYVIYYDGFYKYRVASVEKGDSGEWQITSSTPLYNLSEIAPLLEAQFSPREKPEINVIYLGSDGGSSRERRKISFRLENDRWKRK